MPPPGLSAAVARARRAVAPADPRTDGALLAAFVAARDDGAFAALVARFGPMVFAVCRRTTGHHQDAEDAFQAVFVVLARKAAAVVPREAVGGWLYGVAVRTAREARTMAARRAARETPVAHLPAAACAGAPPEPDLAAVIDAELAALPEKDRALLVRCDLRDESQVEVAAALGVPVGTVYSRLAAARKRLAARLTARGVAPGAGLAVVLGGAAGAAVPADLPARAVASALTPESAPAAVAALSHGVLRAMFLHKLRLAPLALAAVASAALAAGLLTAQPGPAPQPAPPVRVAAAQPAGPPLKGPNRILLSKDRALVMVDPDGKNLTPLAAFDPEAGYAYDAKLSPDGTRVAVVRSVGSAEGEQVSRRWLFLFPAAGKGEPVDLKVECETAYWSADGTALLVARGNDRPGGKDGPNFEHRVVDAKSGKATPVKLPKDHIVTGWLADGRFSTTQLGGTPTDPTARVYLMNRDGTEAKAVTDAKVPIGGGMPSPDGTRMLGQRPVFKAGASRVEVDEHHLVLIDAATGRVTTVEGVPPNGDLHGYCWSPDGKRIAYTWRQVHPGTPNERARTETESRLIVADPDGKNARTVLSAKGPSQWTITLGAPDWR